MEEFEDSGAPPAGELVQCETCNRCFLPKVLQRHAKICQKSTTKRRRVFDSSRQRAEGTDLPTLKPIKPKLQGSSSTGKAEPAKKPSNWRKKHEDFIATIRAAKVITQILKDGGPLPPPPPPTYDPDYVQCPCCQRRFNEVAADRHIKFCQEKAARMPTKGKLGEGKLGDAKKPPGCTPTKPPAPVKKANSPAVSTVPSASSRLPQRSGLGQPSGISSSKVPSAGSVRNNPSGLTSGAGSKTRGVSSGYGSMRTPQPGTSTNKKKVDTCISRNDVDDAVDNGGMKSKFCHACGTKYPVESAKFCCECGVRKMHI